MSEPRDIDGLINDVAQDTTFSGVVRVSVAGAPTVEAAFGLADRSQSVVNTVDTRFGVASGGKLFTALAIGALIDEGRLALETRLADIIDPALPNLSPDVTIGHLLTHTSGVYDFYDEELIDDFDAFELPIPAFKLLTLDAYRPMLAAGPRKFEPGERFAYSNGGYVLLGLAIEAATRTPYHQLVADRVFGRARMASSGFFRFDQLPAKVATGYVDQPDGGWRTNVFSLPIIGGPDGGAFTTASDVEALWLALFDEQILTPALTASFLARQVSWKEGTDYGYGVWVGGPEARPRFHIEGSDAGVSFKSTCYARSTIATVLSNTSEGAWPVAAAIDRFFEFGR